MKKFIYERSIKFADTDAAGVVYFASLLSICHEAYEDYLATVFQFNLRDFFRVMAIPIIHGEIDFFQPLFCGDRIFVEMFPLIITNKVFEITYTVMKNDLEVAKALTRHIAIDGESRQTQPLPDIFLESWKKK
jgi:1,4-dihydroxy-2-naphthoyl-CoA hydrolase